MRQFTKLPLDRQQAVHRAYLALMSPPEAEPADNDVVALPSGRWSTDLKIRVACWLMHMKTTLPRGHFGPGVEKQPGLSRGMAMQCMALAKGARQSLSSTSALGQRPSKNARPGAFPVWPT